MTRNIFDIIIRLISDERDVDNGIEGNSSIENEYR